jgi:membrane protease YdiL (CAAX protease family)
VGSSALYALVHLESSTLARLFGVFPLGVLLTQLYIIVRSHWLPIALHWGVQSRPRWRAS